MISITPILNSYLPYVFVFALLVIVAFAIYFWWLDGQQKKKSKP
jgi:hypothetical protein